MSGNNAAAQGIVAGVNAGLAALHPPLVLSHADGVMPLLAEEPCRSSSGVFPCFQQDIDRMFTSRSEYQMSIRSDLKLTGKGW